MRILRNRSPTKNGCWNRIREGSGRVDQQKCLDNLERMIELYAADMLHMAGRVLPQKENAEDAVQDASLKLYRIRNSLPPAEEQRARYLCRAAAKSAAIDIYRKQGREIPADSEILAQLETQRRSIDPAPLMEGDTLGILLRQMSPLRQEIFILRYDDELKPAEIAGILGISVLSVYQHLKRGKKWLKEQLDQTGCRIR